MRKFDNEELETHNSQLVHPQKDNKCDDDVLSRSQFFNFCLPMIEARQHSQIMLHGVDQVRQVHRESCNGLVKVGQVFRCQLGHIPQDPPELPRVITAISAHCLLVNSCDELTEGAP